MREHKILTISLCVILVQGIVFGKENQPPQPVPLSKPIANGRGLLAVTEDTDLRNQLAPTPVVIALDPDPDDPVQESCECCIFGDEESEDPDYPSTVPFGLEGHISHTKVKISQKCLTSADQGLTAAQWAVRLGVSSSATIRGMWWKEGFYLDAGHGCNPFDERCSPSDGIYHRPSLMYSWSTTINPSVPGTYELKATFSIQDSSNTTCGNYFNDMYRVTKSKICSVQILPADPAALFADDDKDGISNIDEADYPSLNATNPFTYSDGVLDSVRIRTGTAITSADFDGDGLVGSQEASNGSTAFHADSDRDGVGDATDDYPLNPSRSSSGSSPIDSTAPVITVSYPL